MKLNLLILNALPNIPTQKKGFTLIELLVVIVIVSILAAVSLPALIGQIGKARETEMKQVVGTVNRAQQEEHFERGVFATNLVALEVGFETGDYLDTSGLNVPNSTTSAYVLPSNTDAATDRVRLYGGGIVHNAGNYASVICQTEEAITGTTVALTSGDVSLTTANPGASCTTASGPSLTTLE